MGIYSAGLIGGKFPFIERKHLGTGYVGTRLVYRPMDGGQLILEMRGAVDLVTQKTDTMANYALRYFFIYYKIRVLLLSMYSCILSNILIFVSYNLFPLPRLRICWN